MDMLTISLLAGGGVALLALCSGIWLGSVLSRRKLDQRQQDEDIRSARALSQALQNDAQALAALPTRLRAQLVLSALGDGVQNRPLAVQSGQSMQALYSSAPNRVQLTQNHACNTWRADNPLKVANAQG